MYRDFIPSADADLLLWAQANSALITATPTAFSLTAAIATAYAAKVTAFDAKLLAARAENRGKVNIIEKREARADLVASARDWARIVQAAPTTTTAQRGALGINLRDNPGVPVNPPGSPPVLTVTEAIGRTFKVKVRGTDTAGRSKPAGAQGATLFVFVGPAPAADPKLWTCLGQATRGNFVVQLDAGVPAGARVWLSAVWYSPRGAYTQMSDPISAYVAGGIASGEANGAFADAPAEVPALKAA